MKNETKDILNKEFGFQINPMKSSKNYAQYASKREFRLSSSVGICFIESASQPGLKEMALARSAGLLSSVK